MYNFVLQVFGADLVSCLYSQDWEAREMALRRLVNDIVASHSSGSEEEQHRVLWYSVKILNMMVADPVFEVYLSCIVSFSLNYFCGNCLMQVTGAG
jgi:mitogen-activated protein kinase kinase kinase 1